MQFRSGSSRLFPDLHQWRRPAPAVRLPCYRSPFSCCNRSGVIGPFSSRSLLLPRSVPLLGQTITGCAVARAPRSRSTCTLRKPRAIARLYARASDLLNCSVIRSLVQPFMYGHNLHPQAEPKTISMNYVSFTIISSRKQLH